MVELNETERKILNYLKNNQDKIIYKKMIHKELDITYPTILKWLDFMEYKKLIEFENIGSTIIVKLK
ncbi:MAG: hypothetical protein AABY22_23545 [Nanoarchaeota archaeon]